MRLWFYATLTAVVFLVGCTNPPTTPKTTSQSAEASSSTTAPAAYVTLSPADFKKLADDENTFLLDVRTPEDRHIKGTDAVIPYDKIKENQDKLPADKDAVIAVYCTSGRRSAVASDALVALGYSRVYDLAGGATAWEKAGYVLE